jgi:serine/threonine protein kinase
MKPDNILIDYDEAGNMIIKLADFGLSAQFRLNTAYALNQKMGTVLYMAPEQT